MRSAFISITLWVAIISVASFFAVTAFNKKKPSERVNKFIPSIVCFVIATNLTYILLYGWDTILINILIMLLVILLEFTSVAGLISTLAIACVLDVKEHKKGIKEGLKENEEV